MLNILHFTHSFIPVYGGTTTRLINLHQNDGNRHTMILPQAGSPYVPKEFTSLNDEDQYENVRVKRVSLPNDEARNTFVLQYLSRRRNWEKLAGNLSDRAGEDDYQVVYGHNPMEFAVAAGRVATKRNLPLVFEVHGLLRDTFYVSRNPVKSLYHRLGNAWIGAPEKRILRQAQCIVVQTERMKERLLHEFSLQEERIRVVYNGVDIHRFEPGKHRPQATLYRKEKNLEAKLVLGYFGFLDDNNGIRFLLQSLDALPPSAKDRLHVMVIGRGPYKDLVRRFAETRPYLDDLGLVDYKEIAFYYELTDIFVIPRPSNLATETLMPMKLLEAMAMEKIVLVSDVGGMTEVVEDGVNGRVFRRNDEEDFHRKLHEIFMNEEERGRMARQARRSVMEKYSWEKSRQTLSAMYADVLRNGTARSDSG